MLIMANLVTISSTFSNSINGNFPKKIPSFFDILTKFI